MNPRARFPLAQALASDDGATLGDLFSFLSGLYFRGKLTYASAFSRPPRDEEPILTITSSRGLLPPEQRLRPGDLRDFAQVDIGAGRAQFLDPLRRDATRVASRLGDHGIVVLLGSIATGKYVDPLLEVFGPRLVFPREFIGRGDMSRGGLLLRCAREGRELEYIGVAGAVRHGVRPPRLEPVR
jgi:hypothetical protein